MKTLWTLILCAASAGLFSPFESQAQSSMVPAPAVSQLTAEVRGSGTDRAIVLQWSGAGSSTFQVDYRIKDAATPGVWSHAGSTLEPHMALSTASFWYQNCEVLLEFAVYVGDLNNGATVQLNLPPVDLAHHMGCTITNQTGFDSGNGLIPIPDFFSTGDPVDSDPGGDIIPDPNADPGASTKPGGCSVSRRAIAPQGPDSHLALPMDARCLVPAVWFLLIARRRRAWAGRSQNHG